MMHEAGLSVYERYVRMSNLRFEEAGEEIMREWLREGDMPTAVIAAYDYIAIGMIHTLQKEGSRVPEDIAVVGYDDIPRAPYLTPSLSSIGTPVEESCRMTVDLIMKKIDDHYYSSHEDVTLFARYVSRESSGGKK
jgi:LacI family transcriptional regulator